MDRPTISAKKRERMGTRYARRLRAAGQVPGVMYGHKKDPVALSVDEREMMICLHQGSRLLTVDLDGEAETCLVKDFQFDHLGSDIIHIDFSRVDLTEEVEVTVSLSFTGEASGLKTPGSIFRTVIDAVVIRCLAGAIPASLTIDVTELEVGDYLSAGAIEIPEGSTLVTDSSRVLCRISVVKDIEEEEAEVDGEADVVAEGSDAADGDEKADDSAGDS